MYLNYEMGRYGEQQVQLFLLMCGFKVEKAKYGCGDLYVSNENNHLCLEIKTANKGNEGTYKATLESKTRRGITENVDFVILVTVNNGENIYFIIPASVVRGLRAIKITSDPKTYHGKWAQYRYRWDLILEGLKNG